MPNGQLGTELMALLGTAAHHEVLGLDLPEHDLTDRDHVLGSITGWRPDAVIHGAALTAVDVCETEPERAYRVNCAGHPLRRRRRPRVGAHVVYVSTDYVFDGTKDRPYVEWDRPGPQSVYGRTKLGGELEIDPGWSIARTSWVCGDHGHNMVKTLLRLAAATATCQLRRRPGRPPDVRRRPGRDGREAGGRTGARACSTSPTRVR